MIVAIFGFGPGGIVAMINAVMMGYTLHIFEKRSEFNRTNALRLSENTKEILQDWHERFKNWTANKPQHQSACETNQNIIDEYLSIQSIELGKFQTFFLNMLPMLKEVLAGIHVHGALPQADDKLVFKNIQADGNLILEDPITHTETFLKTDHIICADGARREIAKTFGYRFEKTDIAIHQYWAHMTAINPIIEKTSPETRKKYAQNRGFSTNATPCVFIRPPYFVGMQVPSWIMFLPSQAEQVKEIRRWASHMIQPPASKYPIKTMVALDNNPLFVLKHTQTIGSVFRNISGTRIAVIGDARELVFFEEARGARNAMMAAEHYIDFIESEDNDKLHAATEEQHRLTVEGFKNKIEKYGLKIQDALINKECLDKWKLIIESILRVPFELSVTDFDTLNIDCKALELKPHLASFIRFILKQHADGFKEDFFQSLLIINDNDKGIEIHQAHDIIVLINLYVNIKLQREGYDTVTLEAFQQELLLLHSQWRQFIASDNPILFPEMTADALFKYLKHIGKDSFIPSFGLEGKPSLVGMTRIKNEGDLCSLYEVLDHHYDDKAFFAELTLLYEKEHSPPLFSNFPSVTFFEPKKQAASDTKAITTAQVNP